MGCFLGWKRWVGLCFFWWCYTLNFQVGLPQGYRQTANRFYLKARHGGKDYKEVIMDAKDWKKLFKTRRLNAIGDDYKMSVSYHEAGHSVVDLYYGLNPIMATIISDEERGSAGSQISAWQSNKYYEADDYFFLELGLDLPIEEQIEYYIVSLMSGIIAKAFYTGKYDWEGANRDLNTITDVYFKFMIFDIPNLQPFWDKTFKLIKDNIDIVKSIADDLYVQKTLDSEYFKRRKHKIQVNPNLKKYIF